ncbi:54S ribosomal protein L49, mitochondrial [Actinomortierella ambigua]|uniref:Large ribosomal subunit protein mL49 n=1 Tax=Actinomortierella ambigua TaxID=1343610 RepID=A0A9P6PNA9_9FUNG|nr:54S ribosomal protein L49, mitochondrial [Actinomortierella ambigua]KAG0248726.1 54S ribosomal protein L49, mitochondrial [Actinomortierella ambigua]
MFRTFVSRAFSTSTRALEGAPKPALPKAYFVSRTKNGQLPVYSEFSNTTKAETIIRRIQGDASALRADILRTYPGAEIKVNERSNQVILKGLVMEDVRQWLTAKGF